MGKNYCEIIRDFWPEIEKYCLENELSAGKFQGTTISYNNKKGRVFILGEGDPERGKLGLADNVPLPIALEIYLENGKLRFEQTEHTRKFLGVADKAGRRVA
jgi:hypothetical protein